MKKRIKAKKETPLEKFFKTHRRFCAVHIYSGERHCSCGRDEALKEIERLQRFADNYKLGAPRDVV